jgi:1-phosphofructokinase family hexose kinase
MSGPVVVVTANPAIDITYRLAENRPGETNRVREVVRRSGGKGLNVAHVLTGIGVAARSVLPLGGDSGEWMRQDLAHDDSIGAVDVVPIAGRTRSTVAILADSGHPTMYVEPGPRLDDAEWRSVTESIGAACRGARFLVISGSLPAGSDHKVVGEWVRLAREAGLPALVDCSGPALLSAAEAGADILKPNAEELLAATGAGSIETGVAYLRTLGAGRVVVSRGAEGILAFDGDTRVAVPAVPDVTGNPTGAGDAAAAGLIAALQRGYSFRQALTWASAAGAAAVRQSVAGLVDLDDFDSGVALLGGPKR